MRDQPARLPTLMVLTTMELAIIPRPRNSVCNSRVPSFTFVLRESSSRREITLNQLKWLTDQSRVLHVAKREI